MRQRQLIHSGYSLIELVAAMTAATVLLVSLSATVMLSTRLLETPLEDQQHWHDQEIADRVAADLRYSTTVNDATSYGFEITKPNAVTGNSEMVSYEAYLDGLTRRIDNGPVIELDIDPPGQSHIVDGYTAPTYLPPDDVVRLRGVSSVASTNSTSFVLLTIPPGCKDGDLLVLAVASRATWFVSLAPSGWTQLQTSDANDLSLAVYYRTFTNALDPTLAVIPGPASSVAAVMIAIENADTSNVYGSLGAATGFALAANSNTHPAPLESSNADPNHLNLQFLAAQYQPWHSRSLGLPAFTDVIQETAAAGISTLECSIAIAIRNGATPTLATTPRVWHQASGFWSQIGIQLGAAP